jgi:hypothetical protein
MRALTDEAAGQWCTANGLTYRGRSIRFPEAPPTAVMLSWPLEPNRLPYLALYLFDLDLDAPSECLLWVREWSVETDLMVDVAVTHFDRLRRSYGITEGLQEKPATLMDASEVKAAIALSAFPILFGWDAYFVAAGRDHLGFVSHDGYVCVLSKNAAAQASILGLLRMWQPTVQPAPTALLCE